MANDISILAAAQRDSLRLEGKPDSVEINRGRLPETSVEGTRALRQRRGCIGSFLPALFFCLASAGRTSAAGIYKHHCCKKEAPKARWACLEGDSWINLGNDKHPNTYTSRNISPSNTTVYTTTDTEWAKDIDADPDEDPDFADDRPLETFTLLPNLTLTPGDVDLDGYYALRAVENGHGDVTGQSFGESYATVEYEGGYVRVLKYHTGVADVWGFFEAITVDEHPEYGFVKDINGEDQVADDTLASFGNDDGRRQLARKRQKHIETKMAMCNPTEADEAESYH